MKLLIAEDDRVTSRMLQHNVAKWGYEAILTSDGHQAWEATQNNSDIGIALLDWMMPEMSGIDLCKLLRAGDTHSYTYVILLTAKSQFEDIVSGFEAGADDYVTKPFNPLELKLRIDTGRRIVELERSLRKKNKEIKYLQGLLPICMNCKKVRNSQDYWQDVGHYITDNTDADLTHSLCPECLEKMYPEEDEEEAVRVEPD